MSVEKWDQRTLCPHGACIGVIGDAGTCNTCGRAMPNWGEERKRGLRDESGPIATAELAGTIDPIEPAAPAQLGTLGKPAWKERQLCSDGACIGLIGADGKCKVCGRPAGDAVEDDLEDDLEDEDEDLDDDEYEDDDEDSEGEAFIDEDDADAKAEQAELEAAADELAAMLPPDPPGETGAPREIDRALCPDGGCVGLIGDDGKCKVCGKEAA